MQDDEDPLHKVCLFGDFPSTDSCPLYAISMSPHSEMDTPLGRPFLPWYAHICSGLIYEDRET